MPQMIEDVEMLPQIVTLIHFRWSNLPLMPTRRFDASALVVKSCENDLAILVVGGLSSSATSREAEVLTRRYEKTDGTASHPWRWQYLPQMLKSRPWQPGVLLLDSGRILVAGGRSNTAEVLRIPQDDHNVDDYSRAQWTLIDGLLSHVFENTRLATIGGRIFAISK